MESLILKFLANRGGISGRDISLQVRLPFQLIEPLLRNLKSQMLITHRSAAAFNDFLYEITEHGVERARVFAKQTPYMGAAPVPLESYIQSVAAQSVIQQKPRMEDLKRAFSDLTISEDLLGRVGQAMSASAGLFLHGQPGNGKTSIAERMTRAYGEAIWIPRALYTGGEIIRLYDPNHHVELPISEKDALPPPAEIDWRWIRIRRPMILVGGELTLDNLEITTNPFNGVAEAPLQLKSNGGSLVIDDFGRQRVSPTDLLNRWIVPLEKRYDFLNLSSGRKIQVPFDLLIVFSTNLEPRNLVDEAFLRRIPYKIDVVDPSETQFREVFLRMAAQWGIECSEDALDYLLERHFRTSRRPLRFCHPRDLLAQVRTWCEFYGRPLAVTPEALDAAVKNYFSVM